MRIDYPRLITVLSCCIILMSPNQGLAQSGVTFTQLSVSMPGVTSSSVAWGDFDNDGDLDLVLSGLTAGPGSTQIWTNNNNGTYTQLAGTTFPGYSQGSAAWGDYDNDEDLDLLITGYINGYYAHVWTNNGSSFSQLAAIPYTGIHLGGAVWGDYDNDGDLDVLLTGYTGSVMLTEIWTNNGNSTFSRLAGTSFPGTYMGSVAWGDYDNDDDLDFLLTGYTGSSLFTQVWTNNGNSTFSQLAGTTFPSINASSVAWGDYDNDGDLDILLTGNNGSIGLTQIWTNNGNSTFTQLVGTSFPGVYYGSSAWGDYDNDGDLDILLAGHNGSIGLTQIWTNDGNGAFIQLAGTAFPGIYQASVAWGDSDNDGDLDILLTGNNGSGGITQIWRNDGAVLNTPPTTPVNTGVAVDIDGNATLSWMPPLDDYTPANGLTYNLRIGTTPGGSEITSAMADSNSGYRHIVAMGNLQHGLDFTRNYETGTYYWSVQAVDSAFAGSEFTDEGMFVAGANNPPIINDQVRVVAENSLFGANAGEALAASNADAGQTLSYAITTGNEAGKFSLNSVTGLLTVVGGLDYENQNSYSLTVTVTDDGPVPLSDTAMITINLGDVNERPDVININPAYSINEDETLTLDADATDPDLPAQTLTFSLQSEPAGASIDPATGEFSWTPGEGQIPGIYVFTVWVSDGSLSDDQAVQITVNEIFDPNDSPTLTNVNPAYVITQGDSLTFDADATDPDLPAQTLIFSLQSEPVGASIDPVTGEFIWTPNEAQTPGTYIFTVLVSDGGLRDDQSVFVKLVGIQELLVNGDFELPLGTENWKTSNLTKDKRKCNTGTEIFTPFGSCAFQFKSSNTEDSLLTQKASIDVLANINIGDTLTLSTQVKANGLSGGKFVTLKVSYLDGTNQVLSLFLPAAPTGNFELLVSESLLIIKPVKGISTRVQFKGTQGKFLIDEISVMHIPNAVFRDQRTVGMDVIGGYRSR